MSGRGPDILRAASLPAVPWKNGGGVTTEIARHPRGDASLDFAWRISVARIACDGPFSAYPDIDRTLAVVSGQGLSLEIEGAQPVILSAASAPLAFPGERPVHARLSAGPVDALNVMTRRDLIRHAVLPVTQPIAHPLPTNVVAAVLVAPVGFVAVDGPDGGTGIGLGPGDAAVFDPAADRLLGIRPLGGSHAWLVSMHRPTGQPGAG
ncbi:HutD family protein [Methylobacterium sp. SI9]|uniref:HutD/Ves family protein n=1 Tax=Methylobacterium guangdongense TaxID=3138811 RepID=UPI00313B63CE